MHEGLWNEGHKNLPEDVWSSYSTSPDITFSTGPQCCTSRRCTKRKQNRQGQHKIKLWPKTWHACIWLAIFSPYLGSREPEDKASYGQRYSLLCLPLLTDRQIINFDNIIAIDTCLDISAVAWLQDGNWLTSFQSCKLKTTYIESWKWVQVYKLLQVSGMPRLANTNEGHFLHSPTP